MQEETWGERAKSAKSRSKPDGRRRPSLRDLSGECEEEGAAAGEFAFGADGAAVGQHDVFGDGEAQAGAAGFAGAGFVDAIEAFEQAGQVLGGDAGAEIFDIKLDPEFHP